MTNDNEMTLPSYILKSLNGAWKLVQARQNPMQYFDLSSDGFWKSFWAIAVMIPAFILWAMFNLQGGSQEIREGFEISYPLLSEGIYFALALPLTAMVMAYFTKFMKISDNFSSMVIAYNWVSALIYIIMAIFTMIFLSGIVGGQISVVVLMMLRFYFGFYVLWFTFRHSLQISGMLAAGVLIFVKLLDTSMQVLIYKIFNPDYFDAVIAVASNPPS
ncbi:MAG: hypothetical protein HOJ34_07305 [Kordiimonadaceae bacterium]|jgi:hypothetical protein|nr:hypothetical protein [Kordiimonadaceae bacterium]MBT6036053.1 hypothetical protein [Kordiimonadaceae bacterium]MBT6329575.1 hypothetical protein [Kordiimonadaceae bacterium]MBT7583329.1 hypothetical protein [Kordiimonadaceae bacterium]